MMKNHALKSFLGLVAIAGAALYSITPRGDGDSPSTALKSYVPLQSQSVHRRGCLDPTSRGRNPDVDVVRLSVEGEKTVLFSLQGTDGLQPGLVVTADEGRAAESGWLREIASRSGTALTATVVLPAAGSYSFIIVDRREITGDEMAAGRGCFAADVYAAAPPVIKPLPYVWRGTVGAPIAFSVQRRGGDLSLVEVTHIGGAGVLLVSVFEDHEYVRSVAIPPKRHVRVLVTTRFDSARVLVEEAVNWGDEPLRAMVRTVPMSIAPDVERSGTQERVATIDHEVQ